MNRELDVRVARALGWEVEERGGVWLRLLPDGAIAGLSWFTIPCHALDEMMNEIERRGLVEAYQKVLIAILGLDMQVFNSAIEINPHQDLPSILNNTFEWDGHTYLWRLLRAKPEERARAFLEAVKGAGDE